MNATIGEFVVITVAVPNGTTKLRGQVTKLFDDGRVEVRVAERGYFVVNSFAK